MNTDNFLLPHPAMKTCLFAHRQFIRLFTSMCMLFILASCGDDNGINYKDDKGAPVASAKALLLGSAISTEPTTYQTRANSEVVLTGKDSDSDYAPILEFDWEQIDTSGYTVELIERNDSTYAFDVPNVDAPTQLQFKLTITDANGKSDEDLVHVNITPADDADHFLTHPGDAANRFYIKAVLDNADFTNETTAGFSFDIVTIAHWIRRDGTDDQMEIDRQTFNSEFPANFAPDLDYDGINDPRNPVLTIPIPRIDADDINKHFETVERERRVERYLIDDIVLETRIELVSTGGKTFELFALDTIDPAIDLTPHIIDLASLVYDGPTAAARKAGKRPAASKLIDSNETDVSLSVTKLLSALGLENYMTASNYYQLLDPSGAYETLEGWFKYAGFKDNDGNWLSTGVARALYVNNYDLGFGRDMYSRKDNDGNVYSFVVNYPSIEAGINKLGEFAVVAMEYSDNPDPLGINEKIVKFYAYIYDERKGGFVRAKSLDFDGRGEKYVPGSCTGCHQGQSSGIEFLDIAEADLGATFLPWDVSAFLFSDAEDPKYIESTLNKDNFTKAQISQFSREAQEEQIRQLNLHALSTYIDNPTAHAASIELVHGWYGDETNSLPVNELPEATFNENYTPAGWASEPELYHAVFAGHCRMCHTQLSSTLKNFDTYDEFINNSRIVEYVYERGLMPLARLSMDRFWSSIYNTTSAADILRAHLESLGKTIPDFPGLPIPSINISPDGVGIATIDNIITVNASASLFTTSYSWSLTSPFGSTTTLASESNAVTSFQADIPGGEYQLLLTAYNAKGDAQTLNTTISIINRTPVAECLSANAAEITSSGTLDDIPVISQLTDSLGDGGAYISNVISGTYGTATIDTDTQTINYQLTNPFIRGIDTIYYQVTDADGSISTTDSGCSNGGNTGYAAITIDSTPSGNLNPGALSATRDSVKNTYEIDLSWSAPTGITAESYNVYIVGNSTPIANISAPTTSYTHTGLTPNTSYSYEVTSVIDGSESSASSSATATTLALLPSGLSATAVSTSQINLVWSAPTGSVSSYNIYRNGSYLASTANTSYANTGLTAGQSYSYEVSAIDGLPQESGKIGPDSEVVIPAAPTVLTLSPGTNNSNTEIKLDWTIPSGVRDVFCIYRDGALIASTQDTVNTYLNTGLASYRLYEYYIRAVVSPTDNCVTGVQSADSNAPTLRTTTSGSTEPTLDSATVDAVNDASEIDLAWTAATSYTATGYKVYRNGSLIATLGNVTTYSDTGLSYNTSYTYKVKATYDPGNGSSIDSADSNSIVRSTDNLVPSSVTGSATSTTAVNVTWSAPAANVTTNGYTVYRNGSSVGTSNTTSFNDTGLSAGTSYNYTVTARQGSQTSTQSSAGSVATKPGIPSAPTFGTKTTSSIVVNWSAPDGSGGYTYNVQFSTDNGNWSSLLSATASTSTTHTGRTAGTLYYYRVNAIKNSVSSDWSNSGSASALPNAPTGVTAANATSASQIAINWTAPSGNVSSYTVYRDGASIATGITGTSYNNTGITAGSKYTYKVKAIANSEQSADSNSDDGFTAPANVTIGSATATSKSAITLTWSATTGASSYNIYNNSGAFIKTATGTSTSITGLSSYTGYTFKIKAESADNYESLSFSSTASATTRVSYSENLGINLGDGGTCTGCHAASAHHGTAAGTSISGIFPACVSTNGQDCSSGGGMAYGNDSYERVLIRTWVSEGSVRSN